MYVNSCIFLTYVFLCIFLVFPLCTLVAQEIGPSAGLLCYLNTFNLVYCVDLWISITTMLMPYPLISAFLPVIISPLIPERRDDFAVKRIIILLIIGTSNPQPLSPNVLSSLAQRLILCIYSLCNLSGSYLMCCARQPSRTRRSSVCSDLCPLLDLLGVDRTVPLQP